jgi:L-alanine-DL-glutamate epimerase-like enolase superfamily enzyme
MHVTALEAIPVSVPIEGSYDTSLSLGADDAGAETYDHVIVRIETDAGVTGVGEIAPTPYWPRGLTQSATVAIVDERIAPLLEGRDVARIGRVVDDLERAISAEPFPVSGVDAALHDALGKALDRPVYDLLGGPINDRREFELHHSIGIKDAEAMAEDAREAAENGFDAFKVKVGGPDPTAEREAVAAIADAIPGARIRVDANQGWTADEAIREIRALDDAAGGLVLVEQPVPYDDVAGMRRVREAVDPPILADETCFSPADVARVARTDAADIVNVKLAKTGGLHRGREVAAVARAHGLTCFMGSMVELGVGTATNAHFRVATPEITYPTGVLNLHAEETLVENDGDWRREGATFAVPDGPGLGVTLDEGAVEQFRVD